MRLSHMPLICKSFFHRKFHGLAPALVLGLMIGLLAGCESKSWLDPSEMGRYEHDPLQLKILDELEPGSEAPDVEFTNAEDPRAEDLVVSAQDYVIQPNDTLTVTVSDLIGSGIETVRTVRVSETGTISLPLLPNPVPAAGRTEHQLQQELMQEYINAKILVDRPQVSVQVYEARGKTYKILGAIARSNTYLIAQSDHRLLDALVDAGDVTSLGVEYIYIIRKPSQQQSAPGVAPAGQQPPAPAPPARDPLAPQSRLEVQPTVKPVVMLQQAPQPGATRPAGETEGRYIIIDGKPVLVGNQGTSIEPGTGAQPPPAQPAGAPAAPAAQPAAQPAPPATGGFEFNEPRTGTDNRIIRVPYEPLKNGELRYNVVIRPQDLIVVPNPRVGIYYMGGHVNSPGAYNIVPGNKVTLMDAIISARMLDQLSIPARTDIIRRTGPDKYMFVRVDLEKIFAGQQPDIYLKDNDKIMVGTNAIAPFLAAFRNAFRITYGFGFIYDRNFAPQRRFE